MILVLISFTTNAQTTEYHPDSIQDDTNIYEEHYCSENLFIDQKSYINKYINKWVSINKERDGFYGYRIKIFSKVGNSARNTANKLRVEIDKKYDNQNSYLIYREPNFEVHIGDFRTKYDAILLLSEINSDFEGAYIVKEIVNFSN